MRYVSLFSGVEAATLAWEPLGWEPMAFCEVNEFPSAVLATRWPHVPNLGDIVRVDWSRFVRSSGRPDVVVGGSPCQSFSIAGGRESLDGESRLMFEYIRAVDSLRPRWFLWENVPGCLHTKDDAFGQLLDEMEHIGYSDLAWRVLDARFFGVPQRRRRVFLVGHLGERCGGFLSAAVLFESKGTCGDTPPSRETREEATAKASAGPSILMRQREGKAGGGKGPFWVRSRQRHRAGISFTGLRRHTESKARTKSQQMVC
jgi:DNA (cytosine-5)-methyltransferase 1